ncbi:MAG: HAMP domain-containing protein [Geobacteraceae bacterium]|nr:HAMP domain-containing protein [Geobacteraceae bacterium]
MQSLFFRIFLYFWGLVILVALVIVTLTIFRDQQYPPPIHRQLAQRAVVEYGREAVRQYERHGAAALKAFSGGIRREHGFTLLLFDQHADSLLEHKIARGMRNIVIRTLQSGNVEEPIRGRRNTMAAIVQGDSEQRYVAAIWVPRRPAPQRVVAELTRGLLGWQLLLVLGITALACFALARSFATPISRLRRATHRFASGDLSTRIGTAVRGRNEIAALAADFDDMATRIEALVEGQQRLLRDISHELRSPLTRLGIALELARTQQGTAQQQKSLERIELESARMNSMIGQLLDLTRMEHAATTTDREEVDLSPMLESIVRDAAYEAEERNVKVDLHAQGKVTLQAVPELLAQAFENVIRNAVRYTAPATRVEVELDLEEGQARIRVCDQGPGVPEGELEKLFTPFYRVAEARERHTGGTGIGLAIARRAVELHNGSISAARADSGGLVVEIILPVVDG